MVNSTADFLNSAQLGYDILGIPGIILVALFWTLSNFSISDFLCGDHTELTDGRTDEWTIMARQ